MKIVHVSKKTKKNNGDDVGAMKLKNWDEARAALVFDLVSFHFG